MNLKAAILGTQQTGDDAREVLRQAGIRGLQRKAGYLSDRFALPQFAYVFLESVTGKPNGYNVEEKVTFHLESVGWVEMYFQPKGIPSFVSYSHVTVFADFVVLHWSMSSEINFEWRQLEVTREVLIEMWSCEPCLPRNHQSPK